MQRLTLLFPLWALLGSALAYAHPELFAPWQRAIVPLLAIIMLGMGMTLTAEDFRRVATRPMLIALGVGIQYAVMPLAAFVISRLLGLSPALTVGMVLVGSSAGGTASNVITYLGRGDVALSVTLTMTSTLLAVFATPALTWFYAGQVVPVPATGILLSVFEIVVVPVLAGVALNSLFHRPLSRLQPAFPILSMLAIVVIIAIIVALNRPRLTVVGLPVALAVIAHNLIGLAAGFWVPKRLGYDTRTCRTLAIEVGMQNSGLSVALAVQHFSALAALPGAIFSVWHNLSGAALAGFWSHRRAHHHGHRGVSR